jgi:nicotinate-nucleotide--dimethylbenzimidazole phosphoribosyltransferase
MQLDLPLQIPSLDQAAMAAAKAHQDILTKPRGSLGRLESLSIQLAGISGCSQPRMHNKVILTMAGDHGVVAEGVSAFPQEVTPQMVLNFLGGGAAINVLARHVGARVVIVDMGVAAEMPPHRNLINAKVAPGTANIALGPAMSRDQALSAIRAGIRIVETECERGADIIGLGEMGIGNTTPSAAVAAALTGCLPSEIVGRGTGIDDAGMARKIDAVERALHANQPDPADALDVLAKVGGFEIGGMAGAMLAAAAHRCAVMVDGFISTSAAMIACGLASQVRPYLIASHRSQEYGHRLMLDWLELEPLLDLDLRLGEGSGAALGISLAEAACKLLNEMATFGQAGVSDRSDASGKAT